MGKLHYLTALLLIVLLAIASGWIFDSIENKPEQVKKELRHNPDYFLYNFTATTMDTNGKPSYKVEAKHLEHFPDDDSMILQQPLFSFYENNIKTWTAQSHEALVIKSGDQIQLIGNVILNEIQTQSKQGATIILTAEKLTIEPKKELAHTKSKIQFRKGKNTITAVGMRADMNKSKIEFLSQTRSHYVSPKK